MMTRQLRNELTLKACLIGRNPSYTGSFVAKTRMLAIKPLSTKSPEVWRVTLQPSKLFRTLYFAALLLSVAAIFQCPIAWFFRAALALVSVFGGTLIYLQSIKPQQLSLLADDSWRFSDGGQVFEGQLAAGSYRSILVVVVAIKPAKGQTKHAVIWRDATTPWIFSALHIQLALTPGNQLQ